MRAVAGVLVSVATLAHAPAARAGWYLMPRAEWSEYAPRPLAGEATPNLYSAGGELSTGYSIRQALDLGIFGQDQPGALGHAQFGKSDASLVSYGGELGLRFAESVYLGFKGGLGKYSLSTQGAPGELTGSWSGGGGGLAIGAVQRVTKSGFIQTTVEFMHYTLSGQGPVAGSKRQLDSFSLGLAYMFNRQGDAGSAIENTMFKDFLDTIIFF
jgi:hypothetical protein